MTFWSKGLSSITLNKDQWKPLVITVALAQESQALPLLLFLSHGVAESQAGGCRPPHPALKTRPSTHCRCYTRNFFGCGREGGSLHVPRELSRAESIPASAMHWKWESVFLLTFKNDSLSVFEKCHSWLLYRFLGELNSTPVPPYQQSEVGGREGR